MKPEKLLGNKWSSMIIVALFILLLLSLGANVKGALSQASQEGTRASNDSIREEIVPVARLAVFDYNFTQVLALSESGNIFNIYNPVTSKRYVATIDGSVPIEVDAERIDVSVTYGGGGELQGVVVTLPQCEVGNFSLDHSTLKEYVTDNGLFNINPVTTVDFNELERQTQEDQRLKLEESGMIDRADERVQDLIRAQIEASHGEDVEVSFDYIEVDSGGD